MKNTQIASEHQEQVALFEWAALMEPQIPELGLMFAVPNGGKRPAATAARLKDEGVKPGVPDTFLLVPRRGFHGLVIEMKRTKGGSVSPEQRRWIDALRAQGYYVQVCKGFEVAKTEICAYLGLAEERPPF